MSRWKWALAASSLVAGLVIPLAAGAAAGATAPGGPGWPTAEGGSRESNSTAAGPAAAGLRALAPLWSRSADTGFNATVTSPDGSTAYSGCNGVGGLCAYDVATGALRWKDPGLDGTAAATSNTVYEPDDGGVIALDATSGNLVWRTKLPAQPVGVAAIGYGGVQLAGGLVYVELGADLDALDASTGRIVWAYQGTAGSSPSDYSAPTVADGVLLLPTGEALLALDASTGHPLWAGQDSSLEGSVAVSGSAVIVATGTSLDAFDLHGCGAAVCSPVWSDDELDGVPAVSGGVVYAAGSFDSLGTASLDAVDLATGALLWSSPVGPIGSPLVADGVVYAADAAGNVDAFSATGCGASTCPVVRSERLGLDPYGSGSAGTLLAAVGRTLLVTEGGALYALTERRGSTPETPGAPELRTAAAASEESVHLGWTAAVDDGFPVQGYVVADAAGDPPTTVTPLYKSALISGLTPGTSYRFHVAALNADGQGAWSAWRTVTTPAIMLQAPADVTATAGNSTVTASWQIPTGPAARYYELSMESGGHDVGGSLILPGDATRATMAGLDDGTTYTAVVTAFGLNGSPTGSEAQAAPTTPVTPTRSGVSQARTTVVVSAPARAADDRPVGIKAEVTSGGRAVTGGYIDLGDCRVAVTEGTATCSDDFYLTGRHSLFAGYLGTATHAAATAAEPVDGTPTGTTTHLSLIGTPTAGHALVAHVAVGFDPSPARSPGYEGTVQLVIDGTPGPTRVISTRRSTVIFVLSPTRAETLHIQARVVGGGVLAASLSPTVSVHVRRDGSASHLRTETEPGVGTGRVAAIVTPVLPGLGIARGTVTFRDHGRVFATATLNGYGVVRVRLPADVTSVADVTASYNGDAALAPSST